MAQLEQRQQRIRQLLERPALQPDPDRKDWRHQRHQLDQLLALYQQLIDACAKLGEQPGNNEPPDIGQLAGQVAAVIGAAGRHGDARELVSAALVQCRDPDVATELQAAERDVSAFVGLSHGRSNLAGL